MNNLKSFLQIVKEFLKALGQTRTYSVHKNWYCFFGILWGIPIPMVTIGIDLYSQDINPSILNVTHLIEAHPFHLFFLLHPLFFAIVFGAMGTVRYNKEQRIAELDKLKSTFLSMVSHELRTPLTTIQGYISFLRTEKLGTLNTQQKECLKISEETADTLNRLIEELLDMSKIETGEFKVKLTSVDMREIISKAITSLKIFADEKGITLENNLPKELPLARADKERILQVVTNLLENAIKFNQEGGKVSINVDFSATNDREIFSIIDTGIGIPQDSLDKIFDKFYQVDSSGKRRYGGCGLGLNISKNIIELHQGKIWAQSKIGMGSKFFFELPMCKG